MAIKVKCKCGASYDVPDEWAGRKARCKRCQGSIGIPKREVEEDFEVVEDDDVLDDGFEVVEEKKTPSKPVEKRKPGAAKGPFDFSDKPDKDAEKPKKKKKRPRMSEEVRRLREEEREEERQRRKTELIRGWTYISPGIALILLGIAYIWICLYFRAQNMLDDLPGTLQMVYRFGGPWLPGIGLIVIALAPITLGVLNLMGIGIVVTAWEEEDEE
jgi:hypothetical protein